MRSCRKYSNPIKISRTPRIAPKDAPTVTSRESERHAAEEVGKLCGVFGDEAASDVEGLATVLLPFPGAEEPLRTLPSGAVLPVLRSVMIYPLLRWKG